MSKVSDTVISNLLKKVEEENLMPWQQPYKFHNAMNYVSNHTYTGVNRWLIPAGEYVTKNQLAEINSKREKDDQFLYQKGIKWFPVVYYAVKEGKPESVPEGVDQSQLKDGMTFYSNLERYKYIGHGKCIKITSVMRFYQVCSIDKLKSKNGEVLRSKLGDEVVLKEFKPEQIFKQYIAREGIKVEFGVGAPSYSPFTDVVSLNKHTINEAEYWSTVFHELIHSTGHQKRLNRKGDNHGEDYAFEELVAEMGSALLCAEAGISDVINPGKEFENQAAYLKHWVQYIKDKPNAFLKAASKAEEAFRFIMGSLLDGEKTENLVKEKDDE